ncbi:hypothetical protein J6590_045405 [Homalodisca vitripennis]|nr:hypothetical protein J6590_045405 [Homalodisca vitripennis]
MLEEIPLDVYLRNHDKTDGRSPLRCNVCRYQSHTKLQLPKLTLTAHTIHSLGSQRQLVVPPIVLPATTTSSVL